MTDTPDLSQPEKSILLLGNGAVGKTTLARALTGELFDSNQVVTQSVGEYSVHDFGGARLLDFPGQTIYNGIVSAKLKDYRPIAALVFTEAQSSDADSNIDYWCSLLKDYEQRETLPTFLVVTKCDRAPGNFDHEYLTNKHGFAGVFRTSSKGRTGIQELRAAITNVVSRTEDEDDGELGDAAKVIRSMAECLCELLAKDPLALQQIEWRDLERLLARAIEELGFTVELTPPAKDGGKDVVATCIVQKERHTYYIEIKHWRKGNRPGRSHIEQFVGVNAREKTDGGLFLSSSGYTDDVYSCFNEISKQRVCLGGQDKIISLCQQYVRRRLGLWQSTAPLPQLLFEQTLNSVPKQEGLQQGITP